MTKMKKMSNWQTKKAINTYKDGIETKHKQINDYIKERVNNILISQVRHFSAKKLNELDKKWKILYILDFNFWINKWDLKKLNKNWVWTWIISINLNKKLKSFFQELWITFIIHSKDIKAIIDNN